MSEFNQVETLSTSHRSRRTQSPITMVHWLIITGHSYQLSMKACTYWMQVSN